MTPICMSISKIRVKKIKLRIGIIRFIIFGLVCVVKLSPL